MTFLCIICIITRHKLTQKNKYVHTNITYLEQVQFARFSGSIKSHCPELSWGEFWRSCPLLPLLPLLHCWFCDEEPGGPPSIHSCHTRSGRTVAAEGSLCIDDGCSTDTGNGPGCGTLLLIGTGEGGGVCTVTGVPIF